jgi:hypothetical protein
VADVADDWGAAHSVDDDEKSANGDETTIAEAEIQKNQVRMREREGAREMGSFTQPKRHWNSSG